MKVRKVTIEYADIEYEGSSLKICFKDGSVVYVLTFPSYQVLDALKALEPEGDK